jgi:hypothetical protein
MGEGAHLGDIFCGNASPGNIPSPDAMAYTLYLLTGQTPLPFDGLRAPRWTLNDAGP